MKSLLFKPNSPKTLGKSLDLFITMVGFGMVLLIVVVQPLDGDTWWHLRAGEVMYEQGRPLTIDTFSYTRFGEPWLSHGWLTEIWLYVCYLIGGFPVITIWIAFLSMMVALIVYFQMQGPPVYKVFLVLMMSLLLLPFLKARPQMTSLVLFLLTCWIINLFLYKKRDMLLWLIPIFMLWANLHGGFVVGFIYIFITLIVDNLTRLMKDQQSPHFDRNQNIRLLAVLIICALVVMIHPLGIKVWTTLYHTMSVGGEGAIIEEWASPDFHDPYQLIYFLFLLIVWIIFANAPQKVPWVELVLFSMFSIMGFIWRRNLSFMVIYGMIILSGHLWCILEDLFQNTKSQIWITIRKTFKNIYSGLHHDTPRSTQALLLFIFVSVLIAAELKMYIVTDPTAMNKWEKQLFPVEAKMWIEQNHPEGNMLNSYNWGGYFEWYLRDYPVFLDSRADLFGNQIIDQWLDVMYAKEGWQEILDRWNVNLIVIEPGWKIADLLPFHGWNEFFRDDQAVIFGRLPDLGR
jgi:hypothetical protein